MAHELTLKHYWRSSCSWRVRWALALKGLSYRSEHVDLLRGEQHSAEHRRLHPQGVVPILLVDGVPYCESLAIIEWLDECYPQPQLLPSAPWERARVRQLAYMVSCGIQPLQNLSAQHYYSREPQARQRYARYYIERGLNAVEQRLRELGVGTFCYGGQPTLADLCLIPQVYNAQRFACDMHSLPLISSIYRACLQTPACQQSSPAACRPH